MKRHLHLSKAIPQFAVPHLMKDGRLAGMRDGVVYYSVAGIEETLGITKAKVKELMGQKQLEWTQFKSDGPLHITAKRLVAHLSR